MCKHINMRRRPRRQVSFTVSVSSEASDSESDVTDGSDCDPIANFDDMHRDVSDGSGNDISNGSGNDISDSSGNDISDSSDNGDDSPPDIHDIMSQSGNRDPPSDDVDNRPSYAELQSQVQRLTSEVQKLKSELELKKKFAE